ncbi:MAG: DUF1295 domain-containing protein [Pseudomonadales bacterium]
MANKKNTARNIVIISLLLGSLLALAGSQGGAVWLDFPIFAVCVVLAFTIQWLVFIPSYIQQTEHYYDLVGSLTYLSVVILALTLRQDWDTRVILIALMVGVWALRLGSFLFLRIKKDGSDTRFDTIKPYPMRFFAAWTTQGLWVAMTVSCGLVALTSATHMPLDWFAIIGVLVWVAGFTIEVLADYQKRVFRRRQDGQKGFIHSGLWAYSRHPNYFGEIVLWLGVSLVALPVLDGWQHVTLLSPVFVSLLLTRVSGVPMLEKTADKRWQGNRLYEEYKRQTPVLIPRLTKPRLVVEDVV